MEIVETKIKTIEKKFLKKLLTMLTIGNHMGFLLNVLLVDDLQPLSYELESCSLGNSSHLQI